MASIFDRQIQNRNFLSPIGFKFVLGKFPKVGFFCNSARIPEINLTSVSQPSYLKTIDVPGDLITFGAMNLAFLVDENMENYMAIHNWINGLGFPETTQEFKDLTTNTDGVRDNKEQYSDGSLHILNSNYNTTAVVKFTDMYPTSLSSLEFNATDSDVNYFTAQVSFNYTIYNILSSDGRTPL